MSIKQAVTTVFKSRDEHSKNFNRMGKNAKKFGETSSRAFKKASKSASTFGSVTKGILAAGLVQKAIGGLSQGLAKVTTQFVQFDDAIVASSAKFKGLDLTTKKGIKTLDALRKSARDVGATTKFNAVEAAQGLDFYATAGFNAAQAMAVLKPTAKLATIANLDLARTSDIASDSLGAFGLMTKDSAQLQKNFTRLSDVMAKTMTSTNTNMEDMFEAVKKGAPTFTATGQKMETFNALMGIMANSGVKGAEAGTQLRNMMLRLAKPTGEAQGALEDLGIRTRDNKGNFLDIVDVLGQFEKGLKGMGSAQKAAALKTIFGVRSITGLNLLLQEGSGNIRKFRTQLETAGGTTEKMANIMNRSLGNRLKALGSAATELGFTFLEAFEDQLGGGIDFLTKAVGNINLKPLTDGIKLIAGNAKKMFERFKEIGKQTGLFDKIKEAVNKTKPAFNSMFEIIKTIWSFLDKSGTINVLATGLGNVASASSLITENFTKMWKVVKPILQEMDKLLAPINKILDEQAKKGITPLGQTGKAFDILSKPVTKAFELGSTAFRAVFDPTFKPNKQPEPVTTAAVQPPNRIQPQRQDVGFKGELNINGAPPGSTLTQEPGPTAVNVTGLE